MRAFAVTLFAWVAFVAGVLTFTPPCHAAALRGVIYAAANNGPFCYTFEVDGQLQNNVNSVATAGAAFDALKALIGAQGGTIVLARFNVTNSQEQMVAWIRPTVANGPFAYAFEVDGSLKTVVNNVATLGAAADAIKALVGAESGTFQRGLINVVTQ